jgi:hypothetical protein
LFIALSIAFFTFPVILSRLTLVILSRETKDLSDRVQSSSPFPEPLLRHEILRLRAQDDIRKRASSTELNERRSTYDNGDMRMLLRDIET